VTTLPAQRISSSRILPDALPISGRIRPAQHHFTQARLEERRRLRVAIKELRRHAIVPMAGEHVERRGLDLDRLIAVQQSQGRRRSEEHTSELQSPDHLVWRLLLE